MAELHHLLHALPQELFDKIYDLTFAVDPAVTVIIKKSYKPPVQLQISRATRADFASRYYGTKAGFRIDEEHKSCRTLYRWLLKLPGSHQERIDRIDVSTCQPYPIWSTLKYARRFLNIIYKVATEDKNVRLKSSSVLQVDFVNDETGERGCMSAEDPIVQQ